MCNFATCNKLTNLLGLCYISFTTCVFVVCAEQPYSYPKGIFHRPIVTSFKGNILVSGSTNHWGHLIYELGTHWLTRWGRATHICVSKLTIIGSNNGLSPRGHQAVIWTNAAILSIKPYGTYFSEILFRIQMFPFKKIHWKMSSANWWPFCLGINMLRKLDFWNKLRGRLIKTKIRHCIWICPQNVNFCQPQSIYARKHLNNQSKVNL